jgi:Caspase domain
MKKSIKGLIVGISKYHNQDIPHCEKQADAIAALLVRNENEKPNFSIKELKQSVSLADLKAHVQDLFSGEPDLTLLYFAGLGSTDRLGQRIICSDFDKNGSGFSVSDLLTLANQSKANNKIIILDCYDIHTGTEEPSTEIQPGKGTTILSLFDKKKPSGEITLFSNLLQLALQGGAADLLGQISPGSVYAYIDQALGSWAERPTFRTNVNRFVSLRSINPPVAIAILRKLDKHFHSTDSEFTLDKTYEDTNPEAIPAHCLVFKELQELEGVGLVAPTGEKHMYYAAQNEKSCHLTLLGKHYWRLAKTNKI